MTPRTDHDSVFLQSVFLIASAYTELGGNIMHPKFSGKTHVRTLIFVLVFGMMTHLCPVASRLAVSIRRNRQTVADFGVLNDTPVTVKIRDTEGARGIWLNGFELKQAR
jgi:hypothetical protein